MSKTFQDVAPQTKKALMVSTLSNNKEFLQLDNVDKNKFIKYFLESNYGKKSGEVDLIDESKTNQDFNSKLKFYVEHTDQLEDNLFWEIRHKTLELEICDLELLEILQSRPEAEGSYNNKYWQFSLEYLTENSQLITFAGTNEELEHNLQIISSIDVAFSEHQAHALESLGDRIIVSDL